MHKEHAMKNVKLKAIATVQAGAAISYFHKTALPNGWAVKLMGSESLSNDGRLTLTKAIEHWVASPLLDKFVLKRNDVLVQMRGSAFKASFVKEIPDNKVFTVNSNTAIVRLDDDALLPEVLCFFLNSEHFKQTTLKQTQSNLVLMNLKALADVAITLPDMATQKKLQALYYAQLELTQSTLDLLAQQHVVTEAKFFDLMQCNTL